MAAGRCRPCAFGRFTVPSAWALLLSLVACSVSARRAPQADVPPTCEPACTDRVCGPDGCGGHCGTCPADAFCSAGVCVPEGVGPGPHPVLESLELGRIVDVVADGDEVFVARVQSVESFTQSSPGHLVRRATLPLVDVDELESIVVAGERVWGTDGISAFLLDRQLSTAPLRPSLLESDRVEAFAATESHVYGVLRDGPLSSGVGLRMYDVSVPEQPIGQGTLMFPAARAALVGPTDDGRLLLVWSSDGVVVQEVDVSDPESPGLRGVPLHLEMSDWGSAIVGPRHLFVRSRGSGDEDGALAIIGLDEPNGLHVAGIWPGVWSVRCAADDSLWVGEPGGAIAVYDIGDLAAPALMSVTSVGRASDEPGLVRLSQAGTGHQAWATTDDGLYFVDADSPDAWSGPPVLESLSGQDIASWVPPFLLPAPRENLRVIASTNTTRPRTTDWLEAGAPSQYRMDAPVSGQPPVGCMLASTPGEPDDVESVVLLDLSDPAHPAERARIDGPPGEGPMALRHPDAVAAFDGGCMVLSDGRLLLVTAGHEVASVTAAVEIPGSHTNVVVLGSHAFVGARGVQSTRGVGSTGSFDGSSSVVHSVDLTLPATPRVVSLMPVCAGADVEPNLMVHPGQPPLLSVWCGEGDCEIYDLSDRDAPRPRGRIQAPAPPVRNWFWFTAGIALPYGYVVEHLSDFRYNLVVFDLSDLDHPVRAGATPIPTPVCDGFAAMPFGRRLVATSACLAVFGPAPP